MSDGTLTDAQEAEVETVLGAIVIGSFAATIQQERMARSAMLEAVCYAPSAPLAVQVEAAARIAGWLQDARPAFSAWKLSGADQTSIERTRAGSNALRGSGASALLARWRVLRASPGF